MNLANFLPGFKTYLGIAITLFGTIAATFHWDWWGAISGDVGTAANQVVDLIGIVIAIVGRALAKPSA
jgi:hypothetical protein